VDVGVKNLTWLLNAPQLYKKTRHFDVNHTDAVAYYGTSSALTNLKSIADWYNQITLQTLSINDMSLINGGVFDLGLSYVAIPHKSGHQLHRTGESADINQDIVNNVKLDCTKNKSLLLSVFFVMGRNGGKIYANRQLPSLGHFLCETTNNNNIHIDL
jgi:murein endopeptidase